MYCFPMASTSHDSHYHWVTCSFSDDIIWVSKDVVQHVQAPGRLKQVFSWRYCRVPGYDKPQQSWSVSLRGSTLVNNFYSQGLAPPPWYFRLTEWLAIWWFPEFLDIFGYPQSSSISRLGFSIINKPFWGIPHFRKPPCMIIHQTTNFNGSNKQRNKRRMQFTHLSRDHPERSNGLRHHTFPIRYLLLLASQQINGNSYWWIWIWFTSC